MFIGRRRKLLKTLFRNRKTCFESSRARHNGARAERHDSSETGCRRDEMEDSAQYESAVSLFRERYRPSVNRLF
jgi:hypothetical protein